MSCVTLYSTGDDGSAMSFGRAVFVKGTDDSPDAWTHHYYIENEHGKMVEVGSKGGGGEVLLYVAKRWAPWTRVMGSTMAQLETLLLNHPPEQYLYGIKYNHGQGAFTRSSSTVGTEAFVCPVQHPTRREERQREWKRRTRKQMKTWQQRSRAGCEAA